MSKETDVVDVDEYFGEELEELVATAVRELPQSPQFDRVTTAALGKAASKSVFAEIVD